MPEKILVVDDDLETLRLVSLMLQRQGFEVLSASSGQDALKLARQEHPRLIVLDIMMPEVDGYEVTRHLRNDPEIDTIPVLMFTAKTQVDDKVMGYEAGADDYITKPVHPAELVARIRALLARGSGRSASRPAPTRRGYMVGVIAPRGGVGASSLVLNLSISLFKRIRIDPVAVELRPGHGSWALDLGLSSPDSLNCLLDLDPAKIQGPTIEDQLMRSPYGVRLLMASYNPKDVAYANHTAQIQALLQKLPYLSMLTLVDLGATFLSGFETIAPLFQEMLVLTEPYPGCVRRTRLLINDLIDKGFGKSKLITVIMVNRQRADMQMSVTQVQDMLERPIAQAIPPVPELAYQAAIKNVPMITLQPDGLVAQQFNQLADLLGQRIPRL